MSGTNPGAGGNLPTELSSFVGRWRELGEVKRLLGRARLVTLTGVGGTGKTRLALRVSGELRRALPDGVWFVDLAALRAPEPHIVEVQDLDVLANLVMVTLGLREQPGVASSLDQLVEYLTDWQSLLVLDNCEHLLPPCAVLVDTLLRRCPALRILVTSREPLLVTGEMLFGVPPMLTPAPGAPVSVADVHRHEAMALFAARARAAAPDFAMSEDTAPVVAELCRRLDGLPLAIELAAARASVLGPGQILDRLAERFALLLGGSPGAPPRQQTLRASVEWSFDLCGKPEQLLWARVSVFVGGFELDAVEGVCGDALLPADDLLDVVAGLVDKSVLVRDDRGGGTARYRMLETLRDYGQERLQDWGELDQLHRRHRDWYTQLVRRAEADMISPRQPDWLARFQRELPNLRAALEYSLAERDGTEAALTIPGSLFLFWIVYGLHREGRSWADRALARSAGPTIIRLKALYCSAALALLQGDLPAAGARGPQAVEVAAQCGDPVAYAFADNTSGVAALVGNPAEAGPALQRAVEGFAAEPGDEYLWWRVTGLSALAVTRAMYGDAAGAAAAHETLLTICQPRGETWYAGFSLYSLGLGLWKRDPTTAVARLEEGLQLLRNVNDILGTAMCVDTMAWIAYNEGRPVRAATLLGVTTQLAHTMGAPPGPPSGPGGASRAVRAAHPRRAR